MTAFIRDNETTTFTLIGERSCDSFKFCIAGKNIAGQGVFSCNPDTLLYILPLERISHTLFQSERNFLLSVNVTVSYSTKKLKFLPSLFSFSFLLCVLSFISPLSFSFLFYLPIPCLQSPLFLTFLHSAFPPHISFLLTFLPSFYPFIRLTNLLIIY